MALVKAAKVMQRCLNAILNAAVLGGCSLRGGEGTILGVLVGATLVQVIRNSIVLIDPIPDSIEFAVIGGIILLAVIADETIRRRSA